MLTTELSKRQQQALKVAKAEDPFVFSPQMLTELHLRTLAKFIVQVAERVRPSLPTGAGGAPQTYQDESVLVTIMVMCVWQLSPEAMVKRLKRWSVLAQACGFEAGQVISSNQLRRRRDKLGACVYLLTFCLLVFILIRRGVLLGHDWVIDSTIIDAFSAKDAEAGWSFTHRFGYKVHMLICRDSLLPMMFLLSPANANDAPWAPRLMAIAHALFCLTGDCCPG